MLQLGRRKPSNAGIIKRAAALRQSVAQSHWVSSAGFLESATGPGRADHPSSRDAWSP